MKCGTWISKQWPHRCSKESLASMLRLLQVSANMTLMSVSIQSWTLWEKIYIAKVKSPTYNKTKSQISPRKRLQKRPGISICSGMSQWWQIFSTDNSNQLYAVPNVIESRLHLIQWWLFRYRSRKRRKLRTSSFFHIRSKTATSTIVSRFASVAAITFARYAKSWRKRTGLPQAATL